MKGEEKDGSGEDDGHEAARKQDAESRDAFGFLDRQEAMEREKRRELEETNAKESYEYLKKRGMTKACPKCGAKQSHDEVRRPLLVYLLTPHSILINLSPLTPLNLPPHTPSHIPDYHFPYHTPFHMPY